VVLALAPWLDRSPVRSSRFRPIHKWAFWLFVGVNILLGFAGSKPAEDLTWKYLGQRGTFLYFAYFLILLPLLSVIERPRPLPVSISKPVTRGGGGTLAGATAKPMDKA